MVDILIILFITATAIACLMELTKEVIEYIGNIITKAPITVPHIIWRLIALLYTCIGSVVARLSVQQSIETITPLLSIILNPYMLFIIIPIIWWLQLQLDMKVIKEYLVPFIKKFIEKRIEKL